MYIKTSKTDPDPGSNALNKKSVEATPVMQNGDDLQKKSKHVPR